MQEIKVIIGASYGDEGKGLAADFFGMHAAGGHKPAPGGLPTGTGLRILETGGPGAGTINVLTNGGPQRGHTVEMADGRRHVFKHFGSASFRGAASYFDRQFMVNPMQFNAEYDELCALYTTPETYVHPDCRFTTPWDMLVNQMLLEKRGLRNSCGFGIWETVLRYRRGWGLPFGTFLNMNREDRVAFLRRLRDGYFVKRIREIERTDYLKNTNRENAVLKSTNPICADPKCADPKCADLKSADLKSADLKSADLKSVKLLGPDNKEKISRVVKAETIENSAKSAAFENAAAAMTAAELEAFRDSAENDLIHDFFFQDELLFHFEEDCERMRCLCPVRDHRILRGFPAVLFENAQGLLLDGGIKAEQAFTTPSTTGVRNVFYTIESIFEKAEVEVCYVTRSYLTRHGDGPMENEISGDQLTNLLPGIRGDRTNIENPCQGRLRYGMINTSLLADRIQEDFSCCDTAVKNRFRPSVMVTHLNEHAGIETAELADRFGTLHLSDGKTGRDVHTRRI